MLSIIRLRILQLREDMTAIILLSAMALGLTAVFGISFNEYKPEVMVVDEDNSDYSQQFIDKMKENNTFNFQNSDMQGAVESVGEGNSLTALIIKKDFASQIKNGEKIKLDMIKIKDDIMILTLRQMISSDLSEITQAAEIADITVDFLNKNIVDIDYETEKKSAYNKVIEAWKYRVPVEMELLSADTAKKTNGYDSLKHSMIGFSLFFSMYAMVFGIGTILYDKQHKIWQRMLVSPVSAASILGGSMVTVYLTGFVQMMFLILAGKYIFGIDWGDSMAGVTLVVGAFVFAVTSLGLMLSGFVKTNAQLSSVTPLVLTGTSMLGGCMWPLDIVNNKILLFLAQLTPQKWAMEGIESIASYGRGFQSAVIPTCILILMGIIFFAVGVKKVKFE